MTKTYSQPAVSDGLRKQAEKICQDRQDGSLVCLEEMSPEQIRTALHELRVHQIELEMQNEELRRAQVKLDAERARYVDLYELAPVGYCTISGLGLIVQANLALAVALGFPRSALIGRHFSRFILKEDQDTYYRHRKQLSGTGEPQASELRLVRQDGSASWVRLEATGMEDFDGRPSARMVILDIAERKQAEELRDRIEHIIQHDLRSPALNVLAVTLLLKKDPCLSPSSLELLALMEKSGQQMLDTLSRALDLHKIETGEYHEPPSSIDSLLLIREISENLLSRPGYDHTPLVILVDGAPQAPHSKCLCMGQPSLLRTALQNLMQNAIEASPTDNAISIDLASRLKCRIEIRNNGVVPFEIRERFFEKYSTSGKTSGTGLGTYSAKKFIEAQGGTIAMESSDAKNETKIIIHLPT